jgi:hypothetical protein
MQQRRQPVAEIEDRLRSLRLPEEIIERHVNRLRQCEFSWGYLSVDARGPGRIRMDRGRHSEERGMVL